MRKLFCVILVIVALTWFKVTAGERSICGNVTDETNTALPHASVRVYGTQIETYTNAQGDYVINVPDIYDVLIFQFIGYKPQEAIIGKSDTLNVKLEPATISPDDLNNFLKQEGVRTIAVNGTVTSANDGAPIPGVSVLSENNYGGVSTDRAGKFSIRVPYYLQRLSFKAIGYKTDTAKIKPDTTANISLQKVW
jgi:hypothetical protein